MEKKQMSVEEKIKLADLNKKLLGFLKDIVEKFEDKEIKELIISKIDPSEDDVEKIKMLESILNEKYEKPLKGYVSIADKAFLAILAQEVEDLTKLIKSYEFMEHNVENPKDFKLMLQKIASHLKVLEKDIVNANQLISRAA